MVWGSFLIAIAAAALKTPTRNGYNAQGVNLTFTWSGLTVVNGQHEFNQRDKASTLLLTS